MSYQKYSLIADDVRVTFPTKFSFLVTTFHTPHNHLDIAFLETF